MNARTEQNEFWVYICVTWYIGSLIAWLAAWVSPTTLFANDSALSMAGIIVFGTSALLRLPVLTSDQKTSSIEDHFVWLISALANVNWLGYMGLHTSHLSALFPAGLIGLAMECWLLMQVQRTGVLIWAQCCCAQVCSSVLRNTSSTVPASPSETSATEPRAPVGVSNEYSELFDSSGRQIMDLPMQTSGEHAVQPASIPSILRTMEDGIDATGVRFLAGEITINWLAHQKIQQVVVGFVPAMKADPTVEFELNNEHVSARLLGCTPAGMRLQLKREGQLHPDSCQLSWYVREQDSMEVDSQSTPASLP